MNPSTQELLRSFDSLPTDKVVILPNNKNVILSAQSAAELTVKQVQVIPSTTIPQGLSAMLRLAPEEISNRSCAMNTAINEVETGEITIATRSVEIDGVQVQEGQIIILHNGRLIAAEEDLTAACLRLLEDVEADEFELVTLFYGKDVSKSQVAVITDQLREQYPDLEFEVQEGGQPHYYFIIGIE